MSDTDPYKVGDKVLVNNFIEGQFVDVSSNSIGKGFAGGMKRHNFAGNRATHGVSISHRSHGSTGQCQDPGKVFKGKKMAGRLGNKKITIQNLKVLKVDLDNNILLVKGAVPGHKGSVISVFDSVKKKQDIIPNNIQATPKMDQQTLNQENIVSDDKKPSPQSNEKKAVNSDSKNLETDAIVGEKIDKKKDETINSPVDENNKKENSWWSMK